MAYYIFRAIAVVGICLVGLSASQVLAQELPADFDYLRLAHPDVAEFLELNDTQRTEMSRLVAERAEKVAAATEDQRKTVAGEYDQKLLALLTPDQNVRLAQLPDFRKLRFNFGAQQDWGEMLRWFAKQADLSLVMGTPPRGAFNYADSNEYTPAQAINLLNSILLTKGFTLVRRDKLLILVEVNEGIPDEILPKLTMAELDKRGSFEVVKVTFPLGDKPADTVMAEIKPMLGSYGKIVLLPQSKQLIVTETVGKLKAMDLLIQSIPAAPVTPTPAQPAPPEPMVLESYPLGQLNFATTVENLKLIAPTAIIAGGEAAQKFIVYASAPQHSLIKSILEQLNSGAAPADMLARLQIYSLEGPFDPKVLQEQIALLAPQAKIAVDATGKRLMVFATDSQQKLIADALITMDVITYGEPGNQVQLFSLKRAKPTTAASMVMAISPKATATPDETSGTLLVRARNEEMEIIRQMIDQLEGQAHPEESFAIKSYQIGQTLPADFMATLQTLAPKAKIQIDSASKKLLVIGSPEDQQKLESLITQYQTTRQGAVDAKLNTFVVTPAQKTQFLAILQSWPGELASVQVVADEAPDRLSLWASPQQVAQVNAILEQIKNDATLKIYPLVSTDSATALTLIKSLVPQAQVTADAANQLIVVATDTAHASVKNVLEQLQQGPANPNQISAKFYPMDLRLSTTAIAILTEIVPAAKVKWDAGTGQLSVVASERDQIRVAKALEEIKPFLVPSEKGTLVVYPIQPDLRARFDAVLTTLTTELADVRVVDDKRPGELAVMARPSQHALIREIIEQLSRPVEGAEPFTLTAYALNEADPKLTVEFLQQLFPAAKLTPDETSGRLLVWAQASTHQQIQKALEEFSRGQPTTRTNPQSLKSYKLINLKPSTVTTMLQQLVPKMQLVANDEQTVLLAWGRELDHQRLKAAVEQIGQPDDPKASLVKLYPTGKMDALICAAVIGKVLPDAIVVPNADSALLAVLARADQHKLVQQSLDQMSGFVTAGGPPAVAVYRVERSGSTAAIAAITPVVPRAKLLAGTNTQQMIAVANELEHAKIKETVDALETDQPETTGLKLRVFHLRQDLATQVKPLLLAAFPALKFVGTDPSLIAVWASEEENQRIETLIQESESKLVASPKSIKSYELQNVTAAQAKLALQTRLSQLAFVEMADDRALYVLASPDEHEGVASLLDELQSAVITRQSTTVESFPLPGVPLDLLVTMLPKDLASQATVKADAATETLIVSATETVHAALRPVIAELQAKLPKIDKPISQIYSLNGVSPKDWQTILTQLAPTATMATDSDSGSLVIVARPSVHTTIQALMDEFRNTVTIGKSARAYRLSKADVQTASDAITALLPNVKVSIDKTSRSLIVVANEQDQTTVADTIQQIDLNAPNVAVSAIYSVNSGDGAALATALKGLVPSATYVADTTGKSLLVLATVEEQALIKKTVDQWSQDPSRALSPKVYTLKTGEPQAAVTVLQKLLPGATFAVDSSTRSIAATATQEQHQLIAQTVLELDGAGRDSGPAELRSYALTQASVDSLTTALQNLFKADAQVSVVADKSSNTLIAVARPHQHEMIAGLISATEATAGTTSLAETMEIYPLPNADGKTFADAMNKLFENAKPKPQISFDSGAQQLLTLATAKQHEQIRSTLSQMRTEAQDFELFHLRTLDPLTAQSAIEGLFQGEPRKSAPSINLDYDNGTLLIHATPDQLIKIRALLLKLGETEIGLAGDTQNKNLLRVIPVNADIESVLEQLERIWPKIRGNELRVLRPEHSEPNAVPDKPDPAKKDSSSSSPIPTLNDRGVNQYQVSVSSARAFLDDSAALTNSPFQDELATPQQTDKAPILVIPGNRQITFASADSEALDQLEQVLRAILGPGGTGQNMGNFQTFLLRNAGAQQVTSILKELFEKLPSTRQRNSTGTSTTSSTTPLLVASDERLNMVVVYGSRSDRETIASLIQVLDSPDITDALSINQPIIVTVRNTDADRILTILNSVFRSQLSTGGGRKQVPIPPGLPVEVASLLQQVNVATSGPLLTLGVDTVTNAIIVLAPPQLRDQVKATIGQLDRAVETEPGEEIQIIQLKKTSPARIQRALDNLFKAKK